MHEAAEDTCPQRHANHLLHAFGFPQGRKKVRAGKMVANTRGVKRLERNERGTRKSERGTANRRFESRSGADATARECPCSRGFDYSAQTSYIHLGDRQYPWRTDAGHCEAISEVLREVR